MLEYFTQAEKIAMAHVKIAPYRRDDILGRAHLICARTLARHRGLGHNDLMKLVSINVSKGLLKMQSDGVVRVPAGKAPECLGIDDWDASTPCKVYDNLFNVDEWLKECNVKLKAYEKAMAVMLRDGWTYKEIADRFDIKVSRVYTILEAVRTKFRGACHERVCRYCK